MSEPDFKIEKKKKREKKLLQQEDTICNAEVKRLKKKIVFLFTYERIEFTKDIQRDYRNLLEKIIHGRFKNTPVKKIPEEFELELKYKKKYLVIFVNKQELLEVDPKIVYDSKKFSWIKRIDDQEYGLIDD